MKKISPQKLFKKLKLVYFTFFSVFTIAVFFACQQEDTKSIIGGSPKDDIIANNTPQPISPEGKEIFILGASEGEVSSNFKNSKMQLNSLQVKAQGKPLFDSKNTKIGTLIINVTNKDLLNLDALEKTYQEALDENMTVFFESSKSNRKVLREVYNKLLGGITVGDEVIYAVKI